MAYALSYKGITGNAGLYALIQDKESGLYWDDVNSVWGSNINDNFKIALAEHATNKGYYSGSAANLTPVKGGLYNISIFDTADAGYAISSDEMVPPATETLLEVVNGVQRACRFPVSTALTDAFSASVVQKVNDVLALIIPEAGFLEHLKISGSFTTKVGQSIYRISPVNCEGISLLNYLRNPDGDFIEGPMDDMKFRQLKDTMNMNIGAVYQVPVGFRIVSMDAGYPIVEIAQTPTDQSIISFEVIKKPKRITLATDYVPFPEAVRLGATMFAKMDLGRDSAVEQALFAKALSRTSTVDANTSLGDVEV